MLWRPIRTRVVCQTVPREALLATAIGVHHEDVVVVWCKHPSTAEYQLTAIRGPVGIEVVRYVVADIHPTTPVRVHDEDLAVLSFEPGQDPRKRDLRAVGRPAGRVVLGRIVGH